MRAADFPPPPQTEIEAACRDVAADSTNWLCVLAAPTKLRDPGNERPPLLCVIRWAAGMYREPVRARIEAVRQGIAIERIVNAWA
jgi:hypothetical protein